MRSLTDIELGVQVTYATSEPSVKVENTYVDIIPRDASMRYRLVSVGYGDTSRCGGEQTG